MTGRLPDSSVDRIGRDLDVVFALLVLAASPSADSEPDTVTSDEVTAPKTNSEEGPGPESAPPTDQSPEPEAVSEGSVSTVAPVEDEDPPAPAATTIPIFSAPTEPKPKPKPVTEPAPHPEKDRVAFILRHHRRPLLPKTATAALVGLVRVPHRLLGGARAGPGGRLLAP